MGRALEELEQPSRSRVSGGCVGSVPPRPWQAVLRPRGQSQDQEEGRRNSFWGQVDLRSAKCTVKQTSSKWSVPRPKQARIYWGQKKKSSAVPASPEDPGFQGCSFQAFREFQVWSSPTSLSVVLRCPGRGQHWVATKSWKGCLQNPKPLVSKEIQRGPMDLVPSQTCP